MYENPTCPKCHTKVRESDYYCFNCGTNLKPAPPSISASAQMVLYLKCLLIPPFGIVWAYKYLKQPDTNSKLVGVIAIVITLAATVALIIFTNNFITTLNTEINKQMNSQMFF